jgi:hypothetical protein
MRKLENNQCYKHNTKDLYINIKTAGRVSSEVMYLTGDRTGMSKTMQHRDIDTYFHPIGIAMTGDLPVSDTKKKNCNFCGNTKVAEEEKKEKKYKGEVWVVPATFVQYIKTGNIFGIYRENNTPLDPEDSRLLSSQTDEKYEIKQRWRKLFNKALRILPEDDDAVYLVQVSQYGRFRTTLRKRKKIPSESKIRMKPISKMMLVNEMDKTKTIEVVAVAASFPDPKKNTEEGEGT